MKKISNFTLGMSILVIMTLICFLVPGIGVARNNVEKEARNSHKIDEDWLVIKEETDEMVAMLFYPEDKRTHTFSIYVDGIDTLYGYRFISGGAITAFDDQVQMYTFDGINYKAYISMNNSQICKYEIDNVCDNQFVSIDEKSPFVIVLPIDSGELHFYNVEGTEIKVIY